MKEFQKIFLKCHDANVFSDKANHEVLSKIFYDDRNSKAILERGNFFLIGEKGTGKTIIAQYLSNIRQDKNCHTLDFSQIDFEPFRKMSEAGLLKYTSWDAIWKLLLLVVAAEIVVKNENSILKSIKFSEFYTLIREFYDNKFNPELSTAIEVASKIELFAELASKHIGKAGGKDSFQQKAATTTASSSFAGLIQSLTEAFSDIRLSADHTIFIDKIDLKPDDIGFDNFLQLLRSFGRAAVGLNEGVFAKLKGNKQLKFVLLLRPDIFDRLNFQNQSARASSNSVILNWDTTYEHHRNSNLFSLADSFLGKQSGEILARGKAWDAYVDRDVSPFSDGEVNFSFREFLRMSWFRPRDIIQSLYICQQQPECDDRVTRLVFDRSYKSFSDYLYGEVRDFSRFYFSDDTFDIIERFFSEVQRLDEMSYDELYKAHCALMRKIDVSGVERKIDAKIRDFDEFLQILYSSNIICWRAETQFGGVDDFWAFRERTANQLEPKVGYGCRYAVHYGLRRALRLHAKHVSAVRDQISPPGLAR